VIAILAIATVLGVTDAQTTAVASVASAATQSTNVRPPDSATVLAAARGAQARFERVRRRFLSYKLGASGTRCDETIGRYCYWDDDDTSETARRTPPPAESPRIGEARLALIASLDSATARLRGDDWLAGQHVRYLIEAGSLDAATARMRACVATPWWCSALVGLVHHAAWRYPEADSAFAAALASMPETDRCAWTDLAVLLADSLRDRYERIPCADRAGANDRVWWLADPLHHRAGNDRRTEHYARLTMDRIARGSASGYGVIWRDDLGELLRRFGWPSYFTQSLPPPGRTEPPGISAYHSSPSYHFLSDGDAGRPLREMSADQWTLRPLGARERYAPPYATFATLSQQTSVFRRGDSVVVVSAYDASGDSLMPRGPVIAALTVAAGPDSPPVQTVRVDSALKGAVMIVAPDTPLLASIEIVGGDRIRRARLPVGLADSTRRIRISDVGFFAATDSLPSSLEAFMSVASATATARRGDKLGLFWELYGLRESDDDLTLRVQVTREGRSWLRRAGERVGLIGRQGGAGFGWRENGGGSEIAPRSIVVDLSGLDPGRYRIEVGLIRGTDSPVTASRRLEIVR
jgi:hypothetical protein